MLCQNCNKEQATCHYKEIVNGETHEAHLCTSCASQLGYTSIFNWSPVVDFGFGLDNLLSHMASSDFAKLRPSQVCPLCGSTSEDIARTGRVGCAECYETFSNVLNHFITRIHGNTSHSGRIPVGAGGKIRLRRRLDSLKADLRKAVEREEFERAAELRDEIRKLEEEMKSE
jgi:protein arginine kinase activator